jgi:predicted nucleic acid-binding protein
MRSVIISDTSCFIVLSKIDELDLLRRLYGTVTTTPEISAEFENVLPDWIKINSAEDKYRQRLLELNLGKGESSAIALALEQENAVLILDDNIARKIAMRLGISLTGTLGIIINAKLTSVIPSIKPILEKLKKTNFRLSNELEKEALRLAGE